jgi:phosphocarrier protein
MPTFTYTIQDKDGIHARPAGVLVKAMQAYTAAVTIEAPPKSADAKKLFAVMGLGAKCGTQITVSAEGPDAEAALAEAESILRANL